MTDLDRAVAFAAEAHKGQVDKQGQPIIEHCLRVMEAVSEPAKRVAVLHDVVEDTAYGVVDLWGLLGLMPVEVEALHLLNRKASWKGDWTYTQYIDSMLRVANDLVWEVKIADLEDNLSRWVPELGDDLRKRYERALARLTEGEA